MADMHHRLNADRNGHLIVLEPYEHHWEILVDDIMIAKRDTLDLHEVAKLLVAHGTLNAHEAAELAHPEHWASHEMPEASPTTSEDK